MSTECILITGASRGIGFDTGLRLAAEGKTHVLALARDEDRLRELTRRHTGLGRLDVMPYDLNRPATAHLLQWVEAHGPLTGLINNAGLLINKPFAELNNEDWLRIFQTNVFGAVELIRTLLPHFSSQGAHIVNVGSMGGFQGSSKFPGLSAYSAAKAAVANLTECLAEELKDRRISVNCLALGAVNTEMLQTAFPGYEAPVSSEEMAGFFAWFVREGHRYFNGKILPVSVSTP